MKFSHVVFSSLIKVSLIHTIDLTVDYPRDVVHKYFGLVCFVFYGVAFILYAQAAIVNLPNPYCI